MSKTAFVTASLMGGAFLITTASLAQTSGVNFEKDVLAIFRDNCADCHNAAKQKGGLRLDRRSSALKAFSRRVTPHSSANSMVYLRVANSEFGVQMPPTGPLKAEQIATIKNWIDQGAEWPDSLANEEELPPLNPKAVAMVDMLQSGDLRKFVETAQAEPSLLNDRGPEGSTPFMYAVLYADTATLSKLLKLGANPNKHNDAHATALMWAARDLPKTRLLVKHGADVNAKSDDRRTPLMVAARRPGAAPIVKFLLDKGANPNPNAKPMAESSPLIEALTGGDEETVELLIKRGADAKATADLGLSLAVMNGCSKSVKMLAARLTEKGPYTNALINTTVFGDVKVARLMLDHGADVNAVDPTGRTPLMYACISDLMPLDTVKLLVERGADVNAVDKHTKTGDAGLSVLDIARLNGNTLIVDYLEKHGAKSARNISPTLHPRKENSIRKAVEDSLPLLQRADLNFAKSAGCTSCHNNSMQAMTVGLARKKGVAIDEEGAASQVKVYLQELQAVRDRMHQGYAFQVGDFFMNFVLSYQLVGLAAQNCPADLNTDAAAMLIQSTQKPNGEWIYPRADTRPPICLDYIANTALSMRALQLYAPKTRKTQCEQSARLAASWLTKARSSNNEDRTWRLTGLVWANSDKAQIQKAIQEVIETQRADGGWSDLPSMQSTPYATGRSLAALQMAGTQASDPIVQRGIKFLLAAQEEDGSWYTRTRALGFQPYFDSGFPHEHDQWMSAAATSWATMALVMALPDGNRIVSTKVYHGN